MESSRYEEFMKTTPFLPFDMGGRLTETIVAKARRELGETEEVKARTIPELRKLIEDVKDISSPTDDAVLLKYLRAKKFDVQRSFSLMKNVFDLKRSYEDIYGTFDREALKKAFDQKFMFILPHRDEDSCAVVVLRMQKWDVEVMSVSEFLTAFSVVFLMCAHEPATQVCGVRLLINIRGANWSQIKSLTTPRYIRLFTKTLSNCFPIRFKGIHLYNESVIFQYLFSILKLFMTQKIKSRIHLHGDSQKSLHEIIPKAILPAEDFGGDNPGDVGAWFRAQVETYFETYRAITTYGYKR